MVLDPYELLGIARDATLKDAKAAYRRLAMLFHPDRLAEMAPAVRAEGERRLREATEALRAITAEHGRPLRAMGHQPAGGDQRTAEPAHRAGGEQAAAVDVFIREQPEAHVYDAELRAVDGPNLHVRWGGRHAAALLDVLKREHRIDEGPVRQVEWGAYEVTLPGADMRRLLHWAIPGGPQHEPATIVTADGAMRSRLAPTGGPECEAEIGLERVIDALDEMTTYSLMADVY